MMLGLFLRLAISRFLRATGEDVHECLARCHTTLYKLGIVESRGVEYLAYQLDGQARQWLRSYMKCRLVGSPSLT